MKVTTKKKHSVTTKKTVTTKYNDADAGGRW
jgi:hypothetical protein